MRLALMQPYFVPYIGYFQLMSAVDEFVVYDDVQYIKNGWINRNRILLNGGSSYITLPVERGHLEDHINQRHFVEYKRACERVLNQVKAAYRRAPFFTEVSRLLEFLFTLQGENVASALTLQLKALAKDLGLETRFRISSEVSANAAIDRSLKGQERVLATCKALEASEYVNAPGGRTLYTRELFSKAGLELRFIEPRIPQYGQFGDPFVPNLSIVDVMMFNSAQKLRLMLDSYQLL